MEVLTLKNDGRCRWLENRVLKGIFPELIRNSMNPDAKKIFVILSWISNDNGKVGVDLKWFNSLGIPAVTSYTDLPEGSDYTVLNTGYDSNVHEEKVLKDRGVKILDLPCPYIRKVRTIFENADPTYQYILLCEPNHIIMRNFASLYPDDLIVVQMNNYRERILKQETGRPLKLVPYVTFLPAHVEKIYKFLNTHFSDRPNEKVASFCMWIKSPVSPIIEIEKLDAKSLTGITNALLITTPGSTNKSLVSMIETISAKGLQVKIISSLWQFLRFKAFSNDKRILLVRSPIPNKAEKPILAFLKSGYLHALFVLVKESRLYQFYMIGFFRKVIYLFRKIFMTTIRRSNELQR